MCQSAAMTFFMDTQAKFQIQSDAKQIIIRLVFLIKLLQLSSDIIQVNTLFYSFIFYLFILYVTRQVIKNKFLFTKAQAS